VKGHAAIAADRHGNGQRDQFLGLAVQRAFVRAVPTAALAMAEKFFITSGAPSALP
jgi:hypothetical protein